MKNSIMAEHPDSQEVVTGFSDAEPTMIVSAFQFKNGKRIMVITGSAGIKSFECDEAWRMYPKPFAESPFWYGSSSAREYHLKLRNEIHKAEDFVPKHSTPLR